MSGKDENKEELQVEVEDIQAFVGKNQDYYLRLWSNAAYPGKKICWNWAAFFTGVLWLGYRRMVLLVPLILGIFVLKDCIRFIINFNPGFGVVTAYFLLMGLFGNALYYRYMEKTILQIKKEYSEPDEQRREIVKAGGPSWKGMAISILLVIIYEFYWGLWY